MGGVGRHENDSCRRLFDDAGFTARPLGAIDAVTYGGRMAADVSSSATRPNVVREDISSIRMAWKASRVPHYRTPPAEILVAAACLDSWAFHPAVARGR